MHFDGPAPMAKDKTHSNVDDINLIVLVFFISPIFDFLFSLSLSLAGRVPPPPPRTIVISARVNFVSPTTKFVHWSLSLELRLVSSRLSRATNSPPMIFSIKV